MHLYEHTLTHTRRQDDSPLLSSEFEALVRRFRNNTSGMIHVGHVDSFIELHEKPCRKHGRKVGSEPSFGFFSSHDPCHSTPLRPLFHP